MRLFPALFCFGLGGIPVAVAFASCASSGEGEAGAGGTTGPCSEEGTVEACYFGPPATQGVGACQGGTRTCVDGWWTACIGSVEPADELCGDGIDQNCNGAADEGCTCSPGETRPCYVGPAATRGIGMCTDGTQACVNQTFSNDCVGQVLPDAEICDGRDHNCNGQADDGCVCLDAGVSGECAAAYSFGDVAVGDSVTGPVAQIHSPGESAWYVAAFPPTGPNTKGGGQPHVSFAVDTNGAYLFDVLTPDCAGSPSPCDGGGAGSSVVEWSVVDDQSTAGANRFSSRDQAWPDTVVVRVFRNSDVTGCDDYQLAITR